MRQSVKWFAEIMEQKLKKYDAVRGSDGWLNDTQLSLFDRLEEEVKELKKELLKWDSESSLKTIQECADVANFAMMIADIER